MLRGLESGWVMFIVLLALAIGWSWQRYVMVSAGGGLPLDLAKSCPHCGVQAALNYDGRRYTCGQCGGLRWERTDR